MIKDMVYRKIYTIKAILIYMSHRLSAISSSLSKREKTRLQEFREGSASFDGKQLRDLLFLPGNYEKYMLPSYKFMQENRDIFTHHYLEEHDLKETRQEGAKMMLSWLKFLKIDLQKDQQQLIYAGYTGMAFETGMTVKSFPHYFLYTKTIMLFQSHPSHKEYIKRAAEMKDIGCFGFTQFYHGSFNKGMQTLATYDHQKKHFVLTTQGQKGMKFWIGGAAQIATIGVIWAQLIVKGVSQGPHPFIVHLRCPKTYQVLSGITLGDVGPKSGSNYIDNGFIILDNISVPKENLLGKVGRVDENGDYQSEHKTIDARFGIHMSALSGGRGLFSFMANGQAMSALAIAFRYACSRKQFDNPQKTGEIPIIDYPITKVRLIPNFTKTIFHIAAGNYMARAYLSNTPTNKNPKYISELHALSASTKALIMESISLTINQTRTILGGHGYSSFSRKSSNYHDSDPHSTGEGDNNMLLQQTSKYLMRVIPKKEAALILDLAFCHAENTLNLESAPEQLRSLTTVEALLQALFRQRYANAKTVLAELLKTKTDSDEAWLHFHPRAGNALALAYANYYVFTIAREKVAAAQSPRVRQFLTNSLCLWAFTLLERERFGSLELRKALQSEILALCEEMTADAVVACDALSPSSFIIGSPFANFDGDGMKEYLNLIYTSNNTFRRVANFRELIQKRQNV